MARQQISLKQIAINKDNSAILIAVSLAVFISIFTVVSARSLLQQRSYQAKVIERKRDALDQLNKNVDEVQKLKVSYQAFSDQQQNILGGNSTGTGDKDGDNARIILDSLPSKYDFPALTTSLTKIFATYRLESISGDDEEESKSQEAASTAPQPQEIPFSVAITTSGSASKQALEVFEKSIRPFKIDTLTMKGSETELKINIEAKTYFQPAKKFEVKKETVKVGPDKKQPAKEKAK